MAVLLLAPVMLTCNAHDCTEPAYAMQPVTEDARGLGYEPGAIYLCRRHYNVALHLYDQAEKVRAQAPAGIRVARPFGFPVLLV